jgi:hypothetical protein
LVLTIVRFATATAEPTVEDMASTPAFEASTFIEAVGIASGPSFTADT